MGRFPKLLTGLFRDFRNSYNAGVDLVDQEIDLQKKRVDDLINGSTQPSEVVDARGGFPLLRDKLQSIETDLSITDQVDYARDIQKLSSSKKKMSVQIAVGNLKQFFVNIPVSDKKGLTYAFRKNGNDDYITLMEGAIGDINKVTALIESRNYSTKGGTGFNEVSAPNFYTTVIGDWIADEFTGPKISFRSYTTTAGGLWEAILNEGTAGEQRKNISVYNSTSVSKEIVLFENLNVQKHTIKMVFKGQDPANPVASPRGWFYVGGTRPQDTSRTFLIYDDTFNITQTTQALYSYSNKEFAISAKPAGSSEPFHYVPEHNAIGTAFNLVDTKLLVDGKEVIWNTDNYYKDIETVQLIQKIKGVHPSDAANPMMEITTYHTIKDGACVVSGKLKVLRDIQIDVGYTFMMPYFAQFAKKLKTSMGNTYQVITDQPNYKEYWNESDKNLSIAIVNDIDADEKTKVVISMTIDNYARTMRKGEIGRGEPFSWIEHRSSNLGKVYFQQFKNVTLPTGYEYRFDGRYIVAMIDDINQFVL